MTSFFLIFLDLERILFIWAIRHPASGYVQGINDLVTPFFVVFLSEYVGKKHEYQVEQAIALFYLWSICFPKSAASGHILLKRVVALEYTVEPVLTATAAWNLSLEMVTDLIKDLLCHKNGQVDIFLFHHKQMV